MNGHFGKTGLRAASDLPTSVRDLDNALIADAFGRVVFVLSQQQNLTNISENKACQQIQGQIIVVALHVCVSVCVCVSYPSGLSL